MCTYIALQTHVCKKCNVHTRTEQALIYWYSTECKK